MHIYALAYIYIYIYMHVYMLTYANLLLQGLLRLLHQLVVVRELLHATFQGCHNLHMVYVCMYVCMYVCGIAFMSLDALRPDSHLHIYTRISAHVYVCNDLAHQCITNCSRTHIWRNSTHGNQVRRICYENFEHFVIRTNTFAWIHT